MRTFRYENSVGLFKTAVMEQYYIRPAESYPWPCRSTTWLSCLYSEHQSWTRCQYLLAVLMFSHDIA